MSFNAQALPRRPKQPESQLLQWLWKSKAPQSQPEGFRAGRAPGPNDVFIAVMGVTGSGKSSFISLCSGKSVKIGHDLQSCTSVVAIYAYDISPDRTVYLIDTPGFDDTTRSDTEVLSEIAAWLADSYRNRILLHGIIYLHRITDNRMQGSAKRNFMMFKQLCGPAALKSVILVTTMWDRVGEREGAEREKVLIDTEEFWGWMVSKGSSFHRHDNTASCARDIISLLANRDGPVATELQRQLVDENRSLDQTSAGRELEAEMLKEKEKWEKERKDMEERMTTAIQQRDREAEELLREERDRYTAKIKKVEGDTEKLRATMKNLIADRDKRVARMEKELEEQKAAHKEQLRRFEKRKQQLKEEKEEIERRNAYDMRKEFSLVKQAAQQLEEERKRLEKERDQVRKEKIQAQQAEQRPPHPGTLAQSTHDVFSLNVRKYAYFLTGRVLLEQ
ncbi:hypothetical protein NEMBOFW57_007801 [Staphylotrichum longicolle]|uniref:G domain-containing protein n=1 Tax=Staphylotrichum longicolle TaxID=669026 RepID=A0AAD4HZF5_9PEZI|nr:hypothetical protein NEMBOFW57_007801 [Staphylotrichum longicolle]